MRGWFIIRKMKILDVSPVTVSPPTRGAAVRIYNLLRHLPESYEIRQFSQMDSKSWGRPNGNKKVKVTPSYAEYRYKNWISELVSGYCKSTWAYLPVFYGSVLQISRPKLLDHLLDWSDLILVEFPW